MMVRSQLLRGFDREMATMVEADMFANGINMIYNKVPES